MVPGVADAYVDFFCGKDITVYVVPAGGGIAQSPLLAAVLNYLNVRKMITTFIEVEPSGPTPLVITMNVTSAFRATTTLVDIQNALVAFGSLSVQTINNTVFLSKIYAIVQDLPSVKNLTITGLGTRPYANPLNGSQFELVWNRNNLPTCNVKSIWLLSYQGGGSFSITKNTVFIGTIAVGSTYTDTEMTFTIAAALYTLGMSWQFTSYPYLEDLSLDDFSIPTIQVSDLTINITPSLIP